MFTTFSHHLNAKCAARFGLASRYRRTTLEQGRSESRNDVSVYEEFVIRIICEYKIVMYCVMYNDNQLFLQTGLTRGNNETAFNVHYIYRDSSDANDAELPARSR